MTSAQMSPSDQLMHSTARIECWDDDGNASTGTGFFIQFCKRGAEYVPAVVTNKHVVAGAHKGVLRLNVGTHEGNPLYGEHLTFPIAPFEEHWVFHPNPDVDLAAFPLAPVIDWIKEEGKLFFLKCPDLSFIPDDDELAGLSAVEEILMVGYPNGLWDARNNLPIARRGVTATPPYIDFNGRPEFVIDCACFPGSSGSPIYLYNPSGYITKNGTIEFRPRVKLLGILYAGPQVTVEGEIFVAPNPTTNRPFVASQTMMNLGYCIKARELRAFEEHFFGVLASQPERHG